MTLHVHDGRSARGFRTTLARANDDGSDAELDPNATLVDQVVLHYGCPPGPHLLEQGQRVTILDDLGAGLLRIRTRQLDAVVDARHVAPDVGTSEPPVSVDAR